MSVEPKLGRMSVEKISALSQAFDTASPRNRRVLLTALRYLINSEQRFTTLYDEHDLPVELSISASRITIKCSCGCVATLNA